MRYVVDRFSGEDAVLEREDGRVVRVRAGKLPEGAREGDAVFREEGAWRLDAAFREEKRAALRERFDRLKKKKDKPTE